MLPPASITSSGDIKPTLLKYVLLKHLNVGLLLLILSYVLEYLTLSFIVSKFGSLQNELATSKSS